MKNQRGEVVTGVMIVVMAATMLIGMVLMQGGHGHHGGHGHDQSHATENPQKNADHDGHRHDSHADKASSSSEDQRQESGPKHEEHLGM